MQEVLHSSLHQNKIVFTCLSKEKFEKNDGNPQLKEILYYEID